MPNAPAGWYDYPGAPGSTRYWTGAAWLAPGVGPAVVAPGFATQPTAFATQPTAFATQPTAIAPRATAYAPQPTAIAPRATAYAPQPTAIAPRATAYAPQATAIAPRATAYAPQAEFLPAPSFEESHDQLRPVASEYLQPRAAVSQPAPQEDVVPWDVVGVPRTMNIAGAGSATQAPWQGSVPQPFGRLGAPGGYAPPLYASQSPYGASASRRKGHSGWLKVAAVVAVIVVGLGVRWGVGQVLGRDYSDDGRIEVATPGNWPLYSADNPDITYAMDSSWTTIPASAASGLTTKSVNVIDIRSLSTGIAGQQAVVVMGGSTFSLPNAKASRKDFENALALSKKGLESSGTGEVTFEKMAILKSSAGDRWAIQTAHFSLKGVGLTDYIAVAIIDGHALTVQLIVPDGANYGQSDLLAIVNSISAT